MRQETVTLPVGLWADIQRFMAQAPASTYGSTPAGVVAQMLAVVQAAQPKPEAADDHV